MSRSATSGGGDDPPQAGHDGQLRPAVGVESFQVLRRNRTHPDRADDFGWTYNHAPMIAYWNGRFYIEYLSNPVGEHIAPGQTLLCTSTDGRRLGVSQGRLPDLRTAAARSPGHGHDAPADGLLRRARRPAAGSGFLRPRPRSRSGGRHRPRGARDVQGRSLRADLFLAYNTHSGWGESNTGFPFYKHVARHRIHRRPAMRCWTTA